MDQIKNINNIVSTKVLPAEIYSSAFRASSLETFPKTVEFFELLYSYPSNIKVNWGRLDDFKRNSLLKYPVPSFVDALENRFSEVELQSDTEKNYLVSNFFTSYKTKTTTSNFYSKKTKPIQNILQTVPVYTILNGRGEIVVANSFSKAKNNETKPNIERKIYDFCGVFDTKARDNSRLGLFFMDRQAAEVYLKEIAKSDTKGLKNLGLSVNCIGLDSAYRITREHHPGIDFRFVPKLSELKKLSLTGLNVEKEQMQGYALGNFVSPFINLPYSEYYKGVPVYIAQFKDRVPNLIGHNPKNLPTSNNHGTFYHYVFFEKNQISNFYKNNKIKLVPQSKILTYNLEDLIEKWEDSIKSECFPTYDSQEHSFRKIFNFNNVEFIVNNDSLSDLNNHSNELENSSYILKTKKN
jgi:hypothetical protein